MVWSGFRSVTVGLCFYTRRRNFLLLFVPIFGVGIFVLNFWLGMSRFAISGVIRSLMTAAVGIMSIMGWGCSMIVRLAVIILVLEFQAKHDRETDAEDNKAQE